MILHLRNFTFLCAADKENLLLHAGKRSNQRKSDKTYVKILWKSDLDLNVPLQLALSTTTHKPTSAKTMKSRIPKMHAQSVPILTILFFPTSASQIPGWNSLKLVQVVLSQ